MTTENVRTVVWITFAPSLDSVAHFDIASLVTVVRRRLPLGLDEAP